MKPPDRTDRVEKSRKRYAAPAPHAHRKLRADQARALADAEDTYEDAKAELELARRRRDEIRERVRPVIPTGVLVIAGGIELKVTPTSSGHSFRIKGYLDAGYKITDDMRPFVGQPTFHDRWIVKRTRAAK